jgi:uncharacterized membrane protein (DUF485 family)
VTRASRPVGRYGSSIDEPLFGESPFEEALRDVATRPHRGPDYIAVQHSRSFAELRLRLRRFVFPVTAAFLSWYLLYVLLAAYAHAFMATRVLGLITVGMLLGVAQFATTLLITYLYVSYARRMIDPQVARVRAEAGEQA